MDEDPPYQAPPGYHWVERDGSWELVEVDSEESTSEFLTQPPPMPSTRPSPGYHWAFDNFLWGWIEESD